MKGMRFHSLIGRHVTGFQTGWLGAQFGGECSWMLPSGGQTAQLRGSLFPCHSCWFAFKVVIQKQRKGHWLPFQTQRFCCDPHPAAAFSCTAQPRGSGKRTTRRVPECRLLFTLSKIISQRDNNCFPQKIPTARAWVWCISGWPWIGQFHISLYVNLVNHVFKLIDDWHLLCLLSFCLTLLCPSAGPLHG